MELRKNSGPLKWCLITLVVLFLAVCLLLPLVYIVITALAKGIDTYMSSITDTYAVQAAWLTIRATLWAVITPFSSTDATAGLLDLYFMLG